MHEDHRRGNGHARRPGTHRIESRTSCRGQAEHHRDGRDRQHCTGGGLDHQQGPPAREVDQRTTEHGTQGHADRSRTGQEPHGATHIGTPDIPQQGSPDGEEGRGGDSLGGTPASQLCEVTGQGTPSRRHHEHNRGRAEHPSSPESIAEHADERQGSTARQCEGVLRPGELTVRGIEGQADARHRDDDAGQVEAQQEARQTDDGEDQAWIMTTHVDHPRGHRWRLLGSGSAPQRPALRPAAPRTGR